MAGYQESSIMREKYDNQGIENEIRISIIVPVYNDPLNLRECLSALQRTQDGTVEILVVDDASTDETPTVATQAGVSLWRLAKNSGPAAARNYGARHANGDILFFVDADVVIAPDALARIHTVFAAQPDLAAVFGSYDTHPRASTVISQYRNLLHHFVHQNGNPQASTFWAGCGAIRKAVFFAVGGFDTHNFPRASIEDIELGYRLRHAGYRIFLDKTLQGTHLKRWTLRSMMWTDIACRAIPWSRLMMTMPRASTDLNLSFTQRLSVLLTAVALTTLIGALFQPWLLVVALVALLGVGALNIALYAFFFRQRGLFFMCACIPLHLLYFLCSGMGYGYVRIENVRKNKTANLQSHKLDKTIYE